MVSRTRKFRGSRTHGRGKKAGRGAGLRGGRGKAGLHKHKYLWTVKYDPKHFGRHGFKRPSCVVATKSTINVGEVEENLEKYLGEGFVREKKGIYEVDLKALHIDKLLGTGRVTKPMKIFVNKASKKALEKIKRAGGEIVYRKE